MSDIFIEKVINQYAHCIAIKWSIAEVARYKVNNFPIEYVSLLSKDISDFYYRQWSKAAL